jgi:citrate lyase beta subunit
LTPAEAGAKIRRIEELLHANHRKRSEVELIVSPYLKPAAADDLKRYRDAGVDEVVITSMRPPRTIEEASTNLDNAARTWLEVASKL